MNLKALSHTILEINQHLQKQVAGAVNQGLTLRNWLVGFYIVEYEQAGDDRASYGAGLLKALAAELNAKGFASAELSRYRQFYTAYPQIFGTVSQDFKSNNVKDDRPSIGILMVTDQNKTLVQYAPAGIEESIYVKGYKLKLPNEKDITEAMKKYLQQD